MISESGTSLPASTIATLLKEEVKPVFLLGAGASVRSGIPLSEHLVEQIARWGYCKRHDREFDDPTLMRSDWWPWLQGQGWFQENLQLADNYPKAVEALLKPRENRKAFFQRILRPGVPPSSGYHALARLLARKVIRTVLTTNFDSILVSAARSLAAVHAIEEIKTEADFRLFTTNPRHPQVIYMHGSVEHYTDQNVETETNQLNLALVDLLRPLLRDHPLVVVGYRGAEPSVMRHMLMEQRDACQNYRHGIYWCHRKNNAPERQSPLLRELAGVVGNLQFVEIDGFDELMALLDRALPELITASEPPEYDRSSLARERINDLVVSSALFGDLDEALLRSKLLAYAEAVRLPRPDISSKNSLICVAIERSLVASESDGCKPLNGGVLLFASKPEVLPKQARIDVRLVGPDSWIAEVLERQSMPVGESTVEENVVLAGNLWQQLERASDLLARVNRPFRLKGPTSHDAYRYPPLALKELLTNLLAHRDYTRQEPSVILVTPQEVRFENPGGLVEHVRMQLDNQEIQTAVSAQARGIKGYRNPVIADFFFSAGAMDKRGSGLPDVVTEAANNLNEVTFGPTADNGSFVAVIKCRPEAIALDAQTRTARTNTGELRYSPNFLAIGKWPEKVWKLATISDWKDFDRVEAAGAPPFAVNRNWIWTFADPRSSTSSALSEHVLREEMHLVPTAEMLSAGGPGFALPRLLNMALARYVASLGLRIKQEAGRIRTYFPAIGAQPREVTYQGLFKQATRTVTKPVVSRATGHLIYWEHKAVSLRFERFGENWCLSLVPCYVFTADGDWAPIASERIGPLSTKRASRDYNPSVLHDLVFWARMLSRGKDSSFTIPVGAIAGEDTVERSESMGSDVAIELSSMFPTVVFQEPADANMAATIETGMSDDELREIQATIEKMIDESTAAEGDNGD